MRDGLCAELATGPFSPVDCVKCSCSCCCCCCCCIHSGVNPDCLHCHCLQSTYVSLYCGLYFFLQVMIQQNQLQPASDPRGRAPIPSPGCGSTLRYMLLVLPDLRAQDSQGVLTDAERQAVLSGLASDQLRSVAAGTAGQVLQFLRVLRQQLSEDADG